MKLFPPPSSTPEFVAKSTPPTVAHAPRIPLTSFAVLVLAMLSSEKLTVPPAFRVSAFRRRTAVPLLRVTFDAPAAIVVEPTTSTWLPFERSSVPPPKVSNAPSAIFVTLFVL